MRIQPDTWLSEVLARPVFGVHEVAEDVDALRAHTAARPGAFYFAKLGAADLPAVAALSRLGFTVVEANLSFARESTAPAAMPTADHIAVLPVTPASAARVLDIAECAFRFSRFHIDPHIERAAANRVKREWIRSYVEGRRGDRLLVAIEDAEPAGFLALMFSGRDGREVGVIDLVGVHPQRQGRGIGTQLVAAAIAACHGRSVTVEVGTQSVNVPSVRLYEEMGFRLVRSGFVMHLHTPAA